MASKLNYQQLSRELDDIVAVLQADDLDIDEAMQQYERGLQIVQQLENYLKTAEHTITKLHAKVKE